jgi:hypothetical protein
MHASPLASEAPSALLLHSLCAARRTPRPQISSSCNTVLSVEAEEALTRFARGAQLNGLNGIEPNGLVAQGKDVCVYEVERSWAPHGGKFHQVQRHKCHLICNNNGKWVLK